MLPPLPLPRTLELFLAVTVLGAVSLRWFFPHLWRAWLVRGLALAVLAAMAAGFVLWSAGSWRGVAISWVLMTVIAPLSVALFLSGLLRSGIAAAGKHACNASGDRPQSLPTSMTRRSLLRSTAALPLAAVAGSVAGLGEASSPQLLPRVRMRFPNLHPALEGLRILQLSDLHLGVSFRASDLEASLARAQAVGFDLLVVTGDVADDLGELEAALQIMAKYRPRFGAFASLGNHEYLHDIDVVRPVYERGPIPLLVDRGEALEIGPASLYVAGADDPEGQPNAASFLEQSIRACAAGATDGAFRLLLCHRPAGFPAAAVNGFDLTLSGHTHGGQIGAFGRSIFERFLPDGFLWGAYRRGASRLYTTSGFGHWFPFRLNCPTEIPLIVLERG